MTYEKFIEELDKAGLSVRAFADLIGMNRNSVSNYASSGVVPHHLALIAVLLSEMKAERIDFSAVIHKVSTTRKKPRGKAQHGRFGGKDIALNGNNSRVTPI
ncbi:XRE family transcriptional regulator [Yersinia proxima]|uniref:XRE family transcriptional regulator n=1 Tax=Yersinia proxima TaxID=2890316 RepID=UPI001D10A970|nr:XRE family transcriptional regulator [Yersinia proxima]